MRCSLVIVTIVGIAWDRVFPNEADLQEIHPSYPEGWRRIAAVGLSMLRIAWSRDLVWIFVGVLGVGALASVLSPGSLEHSAEHKDLLAPVRMAVIAMPAYITPMDAMVQLSNMFQHGNSIAAAFTLLILGTGLNIGLLAWSIQYFRWRKTLVWVAMTMVMVVALGFAINRPLYPTGIVPEGHTHAFDNFCSPLLEGETEPAKRCFFLVGNSAKSYEVVSLILWGMFIVGGLVVSQLDPRMKWEDRLRETTVSNATSRVRDVRLPPKLVGAIAIGGLVVASVLGCFIYYPSSKQVLSELSAVNAETCSRAMSGDTFGALHWIPVYEDQLKKLEVGIRLRGGNLTKEQSQAISVIEGMLEELEHSMSDQHLDEGRETAKKLSNAYFEFRTAMQ